MTATATAANGISLPHPVIVLGRDDNGKAHASFFPATDAQPASRAASLMGMLALPADNDAVRSLLPKLPKGKLFDSGKAFVPFVKQDLYKQIAAHLPEADRAKAEEVRAPLPMFRNRDIPRRRAMCRIAGIRSSSAAWFS
ncbi:hypothetical protein [Rhizobium sp. NZLR1]|uniref:hypothetical protein n=1 Tax=Rhizobium sp. NZLR1 TaxID=2731096 RepID=UPI001A9963E0|nr:hypothetical protein [Rhizobium sp. NZLR1]MBX5201029.1 hypothetical protein [Rhizobium sp. NZLR1]QSZ21540.1 hypothetical protein J3O30_02935 [Rhizobium sp. NZLR1]